MGALLSRLPALSISLQERQRQQQDEFHGEQSSATTAKKAALQDTSAPSWLLHQEL
jgi:hypothetical protein